MHIALTNIAAEGLAKAQAPGSQIIGFLADNLRLTISCSARRVWLTGRSTRPCFCA
jgi:hypothetical protein